MAGRRRKRSRTRLTLLLGVISFLGVLGVVALLLVFLPSGNSKAPIAADDSKAHCITVKLADGVLNQSMLDAVTGLTDVTYNCVSTFANPAPTWSDWEAPWMLSTASDGFDAWLAASSAHQVVMGLDLVPQSVTNYKDPLIWEQPCAAGSYNKYATTLAKNLVSYGAGNTVIRLGLEANGNWEVDYAGSTVTEMRDWAKCYDNEVTAMRAVPGAHFLFVWNPNVCTADLPLNEWYPGNSYVDIMGADAYDEDCATTRTVSQEGWAAYSTDKASNNPNDPDFPALANIKDFAAANGKPLSFPEWGLGTGKPDDVAYVTEMARMFNSDDFSFESYFDNGHDGIAPLGSTIPNATAAYSQAFK
jgi:Glycosyl hydrolase family 26